MTARSAALLCLSLTAVAAAAPRPVPAARPFEQVVLAASLFRAAWAYKHDRPWLESQLALLAAHRFDAIRALGVVGNPSAPDYWDGREIEWRWEDYERVIAGLTDLAHDKYRMRVQWTIFADAQVSIPREADRAALVERFIAMAEGREHKILAFEVANEFYQNGFDGPAGLAQLSQFTKRLNAATRVPVAVSSHAESLCRVYADARPDFAAMHFDRTAPFARWSPLERPWRLERQQPPLAGCPSLPETATNNEPLGPGSSVASNVHPLAVVMSMVNTFVAGLPVYVFHSGPGVRDNPAHPGGLRPSALQDLPESATLFAGLAAARTYLASDLPSWTSMRAGDRGFPFEAEGTFDVVLGSRKDQSFIVALSGFEGTARVTARGALRARVIDPMTGKTVQDGPLRKGETLQLRGPVGILTGTMTAGDAKP